MLLYVGGFDRHRTFFLALGPTPNLLSPLPPKFPVELVETVITSNHVRIERIVSTGHASPEGFWYDQEEAEWVVVLKGAARLRFEDGVVEMKPGDFVNIPAHTKHRVEWTMPGEPTIWLAVHYGEATGRDPSAR